MTEHSTPPKNQRRLTKTLVALAAGALLAAVPAVATAAPKDSPGIPGQGTPAQGAQVQGKTSKTSSVKAPNTPALADGHTTVTLITGDVVRVSKTSTGQLAVAMEPGRGASAGTRIDTVGGRILVIPRVAQPYIASGALDKRLFDITWLLNDRYDDESTSTLPLLTGYTNGIAPRSALPGTKANRALSSLDGAAISVKKSDLTKTWTTITGSSPDRLTPQAQTGEADLTSGFDTVWLDAKVGVTSVSTERHSSGQDQGANPGNSATNPAQDGKNPAQGGTTAPDAASSGSKPEQPAPTQDADLDWSRKQIGADKAWKQGKDGKGVTVAVLDSGVDATHPDLKGVLSKSVSFVPDGNPNVDPVGHGTHVISTVAGSGEASKGSYPGVAPGAHVISGKVLGDDGFGQESWIIEGMEWGAKNAPIVSMSLGDSSYNDGLDPMAVALNDLSKSTDSLFVVAAGNDYGPGTIGTPGAADAALTIGAVDSKSRRADFSSYGPRVGDDALKPDLSAPGVEITAARSQQADGEGLYTKMDGTSMATPHVAGAAAIVAQAHPEWGGQRIKDALTSSASHLAETVYEVGAGQADVPAAIDGIDAEGSGFFGGFDYPHDGDDPVSKKITYTNDTDKPVTLNISGKLKDAKSKLFPVVKLSAKKVTVPAKSSKDVTITVDNDDLDGFGLFTGTLKAADAKGKVIARTRMALSRENERRSLDVSALGFDGKPVGAALVLYHYGDLSYTTLRLDPKTGKAPTQRLEPGIYTVNGFIETEGKKKGSNAFTLAGSPRLVVDKDDVALNIDLRKAGKVSLTTPKESQLESGRVQWFHDSGIGGTEATFATSLDVDPTVGEVYAMPAKVDGGKTFEFDVRFRSVETPLSLSSFKADAQDGNDLGVQYVPGSTRLSGDVDLDAVAASGTTVPAKAKGKAVVLRRDDNKLEAQITAAQEAGASLLILTSPTPLTYGQSVDGATIPVAFVDAEASASLEADVAAGAVRVEGTAHSEPRYLYDVSKGWPGQVPAKAELKPKAASLARITTTFTDTAKREAVDARYDCRSDVQIPACMGLSTLIGSTSSRTDYVSTDGGNEWYSEAYMTDGRSQRGPVQSPSAGSVTHQDWFAPIVSAHTGDGFWVSVHDEDWFNLNVPTFGGSGGITGTDDAGTVTSTLSTGGKVIGTGDQAVYALVPKATSEQKYRLEQEATSGQQGAGVSTTKVKTVWDFLANPQSKYEPDPDQEPALVAEVEGIQLPLVQLDLRLGDGSRKATDAKGTVPAGFPVSLTVTPRHEKNAVGAGKIASATVETSTDAGKTWTKAKVTKHGADYGLQLRPQSAGSISLRIQAKDSRGNAVKQEIIDAVRVR